MAFSLLAITVFAVVMLIPEAGDLGIVVVWVALSTAMLLFIAMVGNRKGGLSAFPLALQQPDSAHVGDARAGAGTGNDSTIAVNG